MYFFISLLAILQGTIMFQLFKMDKYLIPLVLSLSIIIPPSDALLNPASSQCQAGNPQQESSNSIQNSWSPSCADPISLMESGLYEPIASLEGDYKLPPWFNATLWNVGQKFAQKYIFAVFLSPIVAASTFITFPLMEPIVIGTGRSGTPHTSNVRYLATMLQMKSWFEQGATAQSKGQISDYIIQSLTTVRKIHKSVNRLNATFLYGPKPPALNPKDPEAYTYEKNMWAAFKEDLDASDIPLQYRDYPDHIKNYNYKTAGPAMNQLLLSLVQWSCASLPVMLPKEFGLADATEEELNGYNHLWAILGHGLGIEDRYNTGLQPDLATARKHYRDIYNVYFLPTLFQATPNGLRMLEHFLRGFVRNLLGPSGDGMVSMHQMLLLSYQDVLGIPLPKVRAQMNYVQRALRAPLSQVTAALGRSVERNLINEVVKRRYFISGAQRFLKLDANNPTVIAEEAYYY